MTTLQESKKSDTWKHPEGQVRAKAVAFQSGRLYFTRSLERKLFFFMTLFMLMAGILMKLGIV